MLGFELVSEGADLVPLESTDDIGGPVELSGESEAELEFISAGDPLDICEGSDLVRTLIPNRPASFPTRSPKLLAFVMTCPSTCSAAVTASSMISSRYAGAITDAAN